MKRLFAGWIFCLLIGSMLVACATTDGDKRGSGGKKTRPVQAQEQVVDQGSTGQSQTPSK